MSIFGKFQVNFYEKSIFVFFKLLTRTIKLLFKKRYLKNDKPFEMNIKDSFELSRISLVIINIRGNKFGGNIRI